LRQVWLPRSRDGGVLCRNRSADRSHSRFACSGGGRPDMKHGDLTPSCLGYNLPVSSFGTKRSRPERAMTCVLTFDRPRIAACILVASLAAAAHVGAQEALPRTVPDPGVITTGQRIAPAGMQTVFATRVPGVAF